MPGPSSPQDVSVQLRRGRAQHFCRGMGGGNCSQMREILFGLEGIRVENLSNFPKISYLISLASPFMCRAKLFGGPHPAPESRASRWHRGRSLPELEVSFRKTFLKPFSEQLCWGITQLWAPLHLPMHLRDFKRSCLDQNHSSAGPLVRNNMQELRGPQVPVLPPRTVRCNGYRRLREATGCSYEVPPARIRVGDSKSCLWTQASP